MWLRTAEGKVLQDIVATSSDDKFTLLISAGTYALDADGNPLTHLSVVLLDSFVKGPPTDNYFIYMYDILPEGATFSQQIELVINYDPADFPKSLDDLLLNMYAFDRNLYEWMEIPFDIDSEDRIVSVTYHQFSTYVLSAEPLQDLSPVPDESSSTAASGMTGFSQNWILIIMILPAVSLLFFIYVLIRWRRNAATTTNP
jgi:hypothetical protein